MDLVSAIAPTISLASSDADVSAAILVVLPPDVTERDILATSDPYVSTVLFFSRCSWLTIYIWGRACGLFYYSIQLSCIVIVVRCHSLKLARTPVVCVPSFPSGTTMEAEQSSSCLSRSVAK